MTVADQRAQRRDVQARRDHVRGIERARRVEQLQPFGGRQLGDPRAPDARAVMLAQLARHAAVLRGPHAPRQRAGGQPLRAAPRGERVEQHVRRRVAALAGRAERAGDRGEQHEAPQVEIPGQLVQVQRRIDLRREHTLELLGGERLDHAVVEHAGGVHHRPQRVLRRDRREQRLQLRAVGHIAGRDPHPRTGRFQLRSQLRRALGLGAAAAGQQHAPHAVHADEVARHQRPERAGAAGDQHRAARVDRGRQGQRDLAGVARLTHEAEGLGRAPHVPCAHRQRLERPVLEQLQQLAQHLLDALGPRFQQVEGAVGNAGVLLRHPCRVAHVGLAHLDEAPAARQQLQRGVDELACEAVEHDVHALAAGRRYELLAEVQRARGGDVVVVEALRAQRVPLAGARGREHLQAEVPGELHRRHSHPAGRGVHQQPLARPHRRQVAQRVVGGEEDSRHRPRLLERPLARDPCERAAVADRERAEAAAEQAHHAVARREILDSRADLHHLAGALAAEQRRAGVQAEGDQHVAEVHAGGAHRHAHLARLQLPFRLRAGDQREALQRAAAAGVEPPRLVAGRWGQALVRADACEPGNERLAATHGDLRLVSAGKRVRHRRCRLIRIEVHQHDPARVLRLG